MKNKAMFTALLLLLTLVVGTYGVKGQKSEGNGESFSPFDRGTDRNGQEMIADGRQHPRSGSWIEMVTRYNDGSTHAVSTLAPNGMKHPEWFRKIQADKTIPTNKIYERFLPQRQQHGIKVVATNDVVREFEEDYHKLALWRQEAGISPQEVARVAVKWMKEKQANAAGLT